MLQQEKLNKKIKTLFIFPKVNIEELLSDPFFSQPN